MAERASSTKAAEELGLAKGRVSTLVQALEAEVGGRLPQRRHIAPRAELVFNWLARVTRPAMLNDGPT